MGVSIWRRLRGALILDVLGAQIESPSRHLMNGAPKRATWSGEPSLVWAVFLETWTLSVHFSGLTQGPS